MKKLVLLLAVAFSVSLFSCGADKAAEGADSTDSAAKTEAPAETPAPVVENDTTVAE